MTPKQQYEERRRLRAERLLAQEQLQKHQRNHSEAVDESVSRILMSIERLADVAELWADLKIQEAGRAK